MPPPRKLTPLLRTLGAAYDRVTACEAVMEFSRALRKAQDQERGDSNTRCNVCTGWIPRKREEKKQFRCSEECEDIYRRWRRAKLALRYCRLCNRPWHHPEAERKRLEAQIRIQAPKARKSKKDAVEKVCATGTGYPREAPRKIPRGGSVPLIPNAPEGVAKGALQEELEALETGRFKV